MTTQPYQTEILDEKIIRQKLASEDLRDRFAQRYDGRHRQLMDIIEFVTYHNGTIRISRYEYEVQLASGKACGKASTEDDPNQHLPYLALERAWVEVWRLAEKTFPAANIEDVLGTGL